MPPRTRRLRPLRNACLAALLTALLAALLKALPTAPFRLPGLLPAQADTATSSYALAWEQPFNRPEHYPLDQRPDPALYKPNGDWIGRLILPEADSGVDWVWFEVQQAPSPHQQLVGQRLRLGWQERPALQAMVRTVSTDIRFDAAAHAAIAAGNVLPQRLDGRRAVGPLQSLAGARPHDDVIVRLEEVELATGTAGSPGLAIAQPPVQITGRYVALVQLLQPAAAAANPDGDRFEVQHFNQSKRNFSGPREVVRIPRQPPDRDGRRLFNPDGLVGDPIGAAGWLLYGAPDANGLFTAQALLPRALLQPQADQLVQGRDAGLDYVLHRNWARTPERKGRFTRVQVGGEGSWQQGERGLLIHNFGGIGGPDGEAIVAGTVTGHFAFGDAELGRDPFSGEPLFALRFHQIYANNPNGIVAGTQDWSAYSGDLQRGWLWLRPISDVLIRQDLFNDVQLSPRRFSLLDELGVQANVMMARYRSGDGTGLSSVTPATSCVQDSSQTLYIALKRLRQQVLADPELMAWWHANPRSADSRRFEQLVALGRSLDNLLTPFGMVRSDWVRNAAVVAGAETLTSGEQHFVRGQSVRDALLSWRSMLPRRGHDDIARVFLQNGSQLWFQRTNQVPGRTPELLPLAPTLLLGQWPWLSVPLRRLSDAVSTPLLGGNGLVATLGMLVYALVALPLARRSGLLRQGWRWRPLGPLLRQAPLLLVMPALGEEAVFRAALLPALAMEGVGLWSSLAWGALSVGLFVGYHPVAGATWYRPGRQLFRDPAFLLSCSWLGAVCAGAFLITGSLWPPVLIHWLAVTLWLWPLGGRLRLRMEDPKPVAP